MLNISRLLGLSAAVGLISLWGIFGWLNPNGSQGLTWGSYLLIGVMMVLAIIGLVGVLIDHPILMLVVFGLSFVPVGLYLLATPGLFRWIGLLDLLFLIAALLKLFERRLSLFNS